MRSTGPSSPTASATASTTDSQIRCASCSPRSTDTHAAGSPVSRSQLRSSVLLPLPAGAHTTVTPPGGAADRRSLKPLRTTRPPLADDRSVCAGAATDDRAAGSIGTTGRSQKRPARATPWTANPQELSRFRHTRVWAPFTRLPARLRPPQRRDPGAAGGSGRWARLGSNQRPLACEASALPLSYAPSDRQGAQHAVPPRTYVARASHTRASPARLGPPRSAGA